MITSSNRTIDIIHRAVALLAAGDMSDFEYQGLLKGKLGTALFFYHLYTSSQQEWMLEKVASLLEDIYTSVAADNQELTRSHTYIAGLAGLGYALNFFQQEGVIEDVSGELQDIDASLFQVGTTLIREKHLDFLRGLFGIIHYLRQRNNEQSRQLLNQLIDSFLEQAVRDEFGVSFINHAGYLHRPGIDLSLAHGLVGGYLIMIDICQQGTDDRSKKMREVVINGITYILNVRGQYGNDGHSIFPNFIDHTAGPVPALNYSYRLAWCNGDLSILYLLYKAGLALDVPAFLETAEALSGDLISRKELKVTGIEDAHFCHGASGAAHMYNKLYHLTADKRYLEISAYWRERTLDLLEQELHTAPGEEKYSLLYGWTGALLVLNETTGNAPTGWDHIFLL